MPLSFDSGIETVAQRRRLPAYHGSSYPRFCRDWLRPRRQDHCHRYAGEAQRSPRSRHRPYAVAVVQELIRLHRNEGLDFSKVTTFNLDEYIGLAPTTRSRIVFSCRKIFSGISTSTSKRTHVPNGNAKDLHAECRSYEDRITAAGGIDLQLLGLGRNGHIGFNEPTGSLRSRTWIKILSEQTLRDNSAVTV